MSIPKDINVSSLVNIVTTMPERSIGSNLSRRNFYKKLEKFQSSRYEKIDDLVTGRIGFKRPDSIDKVDADIRKIDSTINKIRQYTTGWRAFFRFFFNQDEYAFRLYHAQKLDNLRTFLILTKALMLHPMFQPNQSSQSPQPTLDKQVEQEEIRQEPEQIRTSSSPAPVEEAPVEIIVNEDAPPMDAPPMDAPPMDGEGPPEAPPLEALIPAPKYFEGEPEELTVVVPKDLDNLSQEEIDGYIQQIKPYVGRLTTSLDPIKKALDDEPKLQEKLKEKQKELTELNLEITKLQKEIRATGKNGKKMAPDKDTLSHYPLFSEDELSNINKEEQFEAVGGLPKQFSQTYLIEQENADLERHLEKRQRLIGEIDGIQREITDIRTSNNNGVLFTDFSRLYNKKQMVLNKRNKELRNLDSQKKKLSTAQKSTPTPRTVKKQKPTLISVINNPELQKKYPKLKELAELLKNQNASIILLKKDGADYETYSKRFKSGMTP